MAASDLLLRPKIDPSALKQSSKRMERAYQKAFTNAAKASARYTQKAFTAAMKASARGAGSAMHSAFQVGFSAVADSIGSLIDSIDDSMDRVKNRHTDLKSMASQANAFNMSTSEYEIVRAAGATMGLDGTAITGIMETWLDEMQDTERFGDSYRTMTKDNGAFAAARHFYEKEILGAKDEAAREQAFLKAGLTGSGRTEFLQLVQALGGMSPDEWARMNMGMSQAEIAEHQGKGLIQSEKFTKEELRQRSENIKKYGNAENVDTAIAMEKRRERIMDAEEKNLSELATFRHSMMDLQQQINKYAMEAARYIQDILKAYEKGGVTAAFSEALKPLVSALDAVGEKIKAGMTEALRENLPAWALKEQQKITESQAKGVVMTGQTSNWRSAPAYGGRGL